MIIKNKPVWLLAVDGVINVTGTEDALGRVWDKDNWIFTTEKIGKKHWPIQCSSDLVKRINILADKVDIRWHSNWRYDAQFVGHKVGLRHFDTSILPLSVFKDPKYGTWHSDEFEWWKTDYALQVVLKEKRPIIWTDSELKKHKMEFLRNVPPTTRGILSAPYPKIGITPKEMDRIEWFVETCQN